MVITIDGTVGSGKSTAAAGLARRLGARHLDTGAMYRALTLKALETGADLEEPDALETLAGFDAIFLGCIGDANKVPDPIFTPSGNGVHFRRKLLRTNVKCRNLGL